MPLRWIEEAEARQVITIARSEAPPRPPSPSPWRVAKGAGATAARPAGPWAALLRRWAGAAPPREDDAGPPIGPTSVGGGAARKSPAPAEARAYDAGLVEIEAAGNGQ